MHCVHISLSEHLVHGMHDTSSDVVAPTSGSLSKDDEVIDKDINMCNWPRKDLQWDTVFWLW
jgi:hypothetical protein